MDLGITVEGDRAVELKFETFPQDAHARLLERIADFTAELEAEITAAEPSRTGKLAAETRSAVYDEPERIAGRVAIAAEFGKAAALEYGAHGTTKVRAHEARLAHVFGRLISPITVAVGLVLPLFDNNGSGSFKAWSGM